MKIIKKQYKLSPDKSFEYENYVVENEEDKKQFIEKFNVANDTLKRQVSNKNVSTMAWAKNKVRVFGFFESYPKWFKSVSANNIAHPFNFYQIELK